jgi:hypothetical protein
MAPGADLLAVSPSGRSFEVEVKGLRRRNYWLVGEVEPRDDLFYVLAFVPGVPEDASKPPRFCVLTSEEMAKEVEAYQHGLRERGRPITELEHCIPFDVAFHYENEWDKLPR